MAKPPPIVPEAIMGSVADIWLASGEDWKGLRRISTPGYSTCRRKKLRPRRRLCPSILGCEARETTSWSAIRDSQKFEIRNPKSETNPRSEIQNLGSCFFEFGTSDLFQISGLGLRIYRQCSL